MNIALLTLTVTAKQETPPHCGITVAGEMPQAGSSVLGFTRSSALWGELVSVDVIGTTMATAGAPIPAGAYVEVDSSGFVVPHQSGTKVGVMAPGQFAATQMQQVVEILLLPS